MERVGAPRWLGGFGAQLMKHGDASAGCDGFDARHKERGGAPRLVGGFGAQPMEHGDASARRDGLNARH
eukprot:2220622-Pleurochrysis_carterae.AAC.1